MHPHPASRTPFSLPVVVLSLTCAVPLTAAPPKHAHLPDITATFSIVAVDPEHGVCGAAVASRYPAVGQVVPYVRPGVGAFCTQHYHVPKWGERALDLLAEGRTSEDVLRELLKDDRDPGQRQLAIIDMQGRAAVHNPTAAPPGSRYWGAMTGRFYCCQGNTLAGREVITEMARAYEATQGSLADRLMAALVAGDCAGGDHRGRMAAGIRLAKTGVEGDWLSLMVDESDDAVIDLARKYAALRHDAKGVWPGGRLPFLHSCPERLRVIVETDAGGDPDDEQSLVRFLLYANEFDVEGIIANRAQARDGENLNTERTGLGIVQRMVRAYGECWPLLHENDPRFPTADDLLARVVPGDERHDEGVQLVLRAVDKPDRRPVWFLNWGTDVGSAESSLKLALDRVLAERGAEGYARFKSKLRLSSADAFGPHTYDTVPAFPLWVDTFRPELDGKRWYHRFSALTATAGGFDIERDVRTGHGPLGALYPTNTTHRQKEGDTMTFLYLVPTGMNEPEYPNWGSWAGRYGKRDHAGDRPYYFANLQDEWNGSTHREQTLARWAVDLQNDFRARLDWCVGHAPETNHPPRVVVAGDRKRLVSPGETVSLSAAGTIDPDGDVLQYEWEVYPEVGSAAVPVSLEGADTPDVRVTVPRIDSSAEVHLILTVRDAGTPPLARYVRIVLNIEPRR